MSHESTPSTSRRDVFSANFDDLAFQIEELDDDEFNIPAVDVPPTLESILNENDEGSLSDEEISGPLGLFQETADTTSVDSTDTLSLKGDKKTKGPMYGNHGSVLKHVVLRGVSSQLQKAANQVQAGKPTAMAVSSVVAIGTFHGLVLVFDPEQVLKGCLGSVDYADKYGAVSCLAFNADCSRLLSGYSRGQIMMWDIQKGKLLRSISDAHPPQNAVLHIKFTDDNTLAVCSDSGGSVFELNFRRVMGTRTCDARCIFSGSRGEVCTLEPLRMTPHFKDHPCKDVCLVALGTVSKVMVVTIRPSLHVRFMHPLQGDLDTLPILSWQFVVIQTTPNTRLIDPVLAFGRKNVIYFYQVNFAAADHINFIQLQKIELQFVVQNFGWLNSRIIVTLDTSEHLHVMDVRSEEELEVLDIADVQLVYGSSHFKGLATGGNVSRAMTVAGERACYYSMSAYGTQLLFLGVKGVHVLTLRSWRERIDFFTKQQNFPEALSMALAIYEDRAKAVTGLPGKKYDRKELIASKILKLLSTYVDLIMTNLCPEHGKIELLLLHYKETIPVCVGYCLTIDKRDFLFGKMYDRFKVDPLAQGVFLESLELHILDGKLSTLTPMIAKDFVQHYAEKELYDSLETCIVRLNIAELDIHQIMKLCWRHGLYDAIIYIYNKGMNDYITPLEELLDVLQAALTRGKQLTDDEIKLGNKLLVYISCCMAGRAYPFGDIPQDLVPEVKKSILVCVTTLHTKKQTETTVYPYLRTFLQFDTREFLNVLALAFEESEFRHDAGMMQKQRIVDILLQVMVKSGGFLPTQVGSLFTFLARQIAKHENSIMVNQLLFEQVLEHLTNPGDDTRMEERQQALMELLHAGGLAQVNDERVLNLAEKAKFYRICEHLYEKHRRYDKILGCYLHDPTRKPQVFYYARQILIKQNATTKEKAVLEEVIIKSVQDLVEIDSRKTSEILFEFFPHRLQNVIDLLNMKPTNLYHLLQGLFSNPEAFCPSPSFNNKEAPIIDPSVIEKYIDLMCQYDSTSVHFYIRNTEGYRLEETLEICRKYGVMDATAYLLEKAGDVHGSFNIMLEILKSKITTVTEILMNKNANHELELLTPWNTLDAHLTVIIQLCQRNSSNMDQSNREALWFPLLDSMMLPQRQLRGLVDAKYLQAFKELSRHLLTSMMGFIAVPTVLHKVVKDPAYNTGKFVEIRELIMTMFETYNYEKTLYATTTNLLNQDLHNQLYRLCKEANRGFSCYKNICNHCQLPLHKDSDVEIVLFRCCHVYHVNCIPHGEKEVSEIHLQCPKCRFIKQTGELNPRILLKKNLPGAGRGVDKNKTTGKETRLNDQQLQALNYLRLREKTSSRLELLEDLARKERRKHSVSQTFNHPTTYREDDFLKLDLAPGRDKTAPLEF